MLVVIVIGGVFVASCDSFATFVFALISCGGVMNVGSVKVH